MGNSGDSVSAAAADAAQEVYYHLQQADVDHIMQLASGLVTVQLFTLLACLLCLGVLLLMVFVVAIRRF